MKKKTRTVRFEFIFDTIIIVIITAIMTVSFFIYHEGGFFTGIKTNIINKNSKDYNPHIIYKEIDKTMKMIANRTYITDVYDCKSFSKDLVKELKKINISAYCVIGRGSSYVNDTNLMWNHEWVEMKINNLTIPIEATGGFMPSEESYEKYYHPYLRGICL